MVPVARDAKAAVAHVSGPSNRLDRRGPAVLGVVTAVGGFFIAGPVGGMAGLIAGALAARGTRAVLLAGGAALLLTVLLTLVERPLSEPNVITFTSDRPLANAAGAIAAVCLLAGLLGMIFSREYPAPRMPAEPAAQTSRLTISALVAALAAALLGAAALALLGDHLWRAGAIALAVLALALAVGLIVARRLGKLSL
jgi:hypothetical protein